MDEAHASTGATGRADGGVAALIDRAFHYRGDVTIRTAGGGAVTGFLFNRNARAGDPFVQLFEARSGRAVTIPYRSVTDVLFTGRDPAAASLRRFADQRDRRGAPARDGRAAPPAGEDRHGG